ncbi:hypothetical protein SteCoe_4281 [Stentor coeruleus]|uniref:FAD-binding FR-type domain-containing protein n=1 Tax=Stentor coeruleus TaxID=5963 RepID=A0A1R2CV31_9CILI|nr:hypothetical protein SteCoe_4281 [Stentor coeruleus]
MWLLRLFRKPISNIPNGILQGPENYFKVKLSEVLPISDNTKIFRFEFPEDTQQLGLPICQHLLFKAKISTPTHPEGEEIMRKYTPTSNINEKGFFEVPIKIYYKNSHPEFPNGGIFTQYLDSMKIGDSLDISGPSGKIIYVGNGIFKIKQEDDEIIKKAKNIGLIAGGTGITPCFQLLQYCVNQGENANISLLYANKTENDILFRPILDEYVAEQVISSYYVLEKPPEKWNMGNGLVSEEHIRERMPPPDKETLIFHSGPRAMNIHVRKLLIDMGYLESMIVKF